LSWLTKERSTSSWPYSNISVFDQAMPAAADAMQAILADMLLAAKALMSTGETRRSGP
jgi:hypothetical protein